MTDDNEAPFYSPNRKSPPPPEPTPGEPQWAVRKSDGRQITCELRNHGRWGVEVQLLRDAEWIYGRRYDTRELAQREADELRAKYLREGATVLD